MVQAQLTREQICHGISDNVKHFKKIYKGSFLALDITLATDTEKKRIIIKVTEFELYKREYSLVRRVVFCQWVHGSCLFSVVDFLEVILCKNLMYCSKLFQLFSIFYCFFRLGWTHIVVLLRPIYVV